MLQSFDPVREKFLADLASLNNRITKTQAQLTSGIRVSRASDDPAAVGDILQLESDIGRVTQVTANLNNVKSEVTSASGIVQDSVSLLDQARSLAAQGASGTLSPSGRLALAAQAEQILSALVNASRTTFAGRYLFSGDSSSQPAYDVNLSNATGVSRLLTAPATRLIQDSNGVVFAVSKTAQDLFDHRNPDDSIAADNVFAAVNSLRVALTNNDQAGTAAAAASIQKAQDYLSQQGTFYGAVENRLTNALDLSQKFQLQWSGALSAERDTDVAAATTDLSQERLSQQAALQAQASMPRNSLFDFLK
ncbi:MAG: flagellar hook-associated protein 3 [Bryobacterales bacterium]|nr:flagellar hook-associated protein 3 [Bryobacterales bacterium]